MARSFGQYSPAVPMGVTWEEAITLEDERGVPIDLTGYSIARAQLREVQPATDASSGAATTTPVLELTSAGYYPAPPPWPAFEALSIATPTDGTIRLALNVANLRMASPTNAKRRLYWSIVIARADGYTVPVVSGCVTFLPARTI